MSKVYTNTGVSRNSKVYVVKEHADRDELPEDLMTKFSLAEIAKRTNENGGERIFREEQHDDASAFAERVVLSGLAKRGIQKMEHTDSTFHTVDGVIVTTVDKRGNIIDSNFTGNRGNKQQHMAGDWGKKESKKKPVAGKDSMEAIAAAAWFHDLFTDAELSVPQEFELSEWKEYLCAELIKPGNDPMDTREQFWAFQRQAWLSKHGATEETKKNIADAEKWLNGNSKKSACPVCGVVVGTLKAERLMHLRGGCGNAVKDHFKNVEFIDKKKTKDKDKSK